MKKQDGKVNTMTTGGGTSPPARQPSGVPYGFPDFATFKKFAMRFKSRMQAVYPDLGVAFQGSSVTGRSAETGQPFDEGRISDYDIAISGASIVQAAQISGIPFRSDGISTGPLTERDLDRLGLADIVDDASADTGREVNLMIFRTMEEATDRKPTIKVWF